MFLDTRVGTSTVLAFPDMVPKRRVAALGSLLEATRPEHEKNSQEEQHGREGEQRQSYKTHRVRTHIVAWGCRRTPTADSGEGGTIQNLKTLCMKLKA